MKSEYEDLLFSRLADLGRHVGFRMIDLLCWRDKIQKRETRIVNILWFIQKTVWKVIELVCRRMDGHSLLIILDHVIILDSLR